MIAWFKRHFVFHYIGVVHLPVARKEGKTTAVKPVVLMMTESGRRRAVVTNKQKVKETWGMMFDLYYDNEITPWLNGGEFPKGQYKEDTLAEMLVKIIDNKLQGKEK